MYKIEKRLTRLEAEHEPKPELKLTPEESNFINDVEQRRAEQQTRYYAEVCNEVEFERIKKLSTKVALIWYRENIHNRESNEL